MKPNTLLRAFCAFILICLGAAAHAQGTAFTYQGQLNISGAPANGRYDFQFSVFDSASGGGQQGGLLSVPNTPVTNGLFVLTLDFGNIFTGGSRWLNISVKTNGGALYTLLSPRQELTPAPYAITASSVRAGGVTANMLATGAITADKLGTDSVTSDKIADGAVKLAHIDDAGASAYESFRSDLQQSGAQAAISFARVQPVTMTNGITPLFRLQINGSTFGTVTGFAGNEEISEPFSFTVTVRHNVTVTDMSSVIGGAARLSFIRNGRTNAFSGIITSFTAGSGGGASQNYIVKFEPPLATLRYTTEYQIFQRILPGDVLRQMLTGTPFVVELQGTQVEQENHIQYGESDFNFFNRTAEKHGIYYFFEETSSDVRLVLGNAANSYRAGGTFPYYGSAPTVAIPNGTEYIRDFQKGARQTTLRSVLRARHLELPSSNLEASTTGPRGVGEKFEFGFPFRTDPFAPAELQKIFQYNSALTSLRQARNNIEGVAMTGSSTIPDLRPGHTFTLDDRTGSGLGGAYVVTQVRHSGFTRVVNGISTVHYGNEFEALPATTVFRPARKTPTPQAFPCTAIVTGPAGETSYTDKYGRVTVQFHWDRSGANDERSSALLRVASPNAGKNHGLIWIPKIGDEVLVSFIQGDPDQPIVVGSLYNAENMPPFQLPDDKTSFGIQSRYTDGTVNEIRFDDAANRRDMSLRGARDLNLSAGGRVNVNSLFSVNSGTPFRNLTTGQAIMPSSAGAQTTFSISFGKTFASAPRVTITAQNDPGFPNVADTFSVTIRSASTTGCVVNVVRTDSAAGWSQSLRLNWMAWE